MDKTHWRGFHHIALVTADLDGTIAFYEQVLGMQAGTVYPATANRGRHCFIKPGDTDAWGLHFFEYAGAQIPSSTEAIRLLAENREAAALYQFLPGALQHIAFALPSEEEAMELRRRLNSHGVPMTEIYDQGSIRDFVFVDNNGIQIEAAWPKN